MSIRARSRALPAAVFAAAVLTGSMTACSRAPKFRGDGEAKAFFEKVQVIMTREDLDIFRGIPDREARAEYMADFWRMRDPNPETEANEALDAFERRAAFANKWFSRFDPIRGRDVEGKSHPENGCSSDRGMVYILLGPPERMTLFTSDPTEWDVRVPWFRKVTDENDFVSELWHYDRLRISVEFEKSSAGRWNLEPSSHVAERLDEAKLKFIDDHYRYASTKPLAFTAKYDGQAFRLEVPAEGVDFDDEWKAALEVTVNVYRDGKKVDRVSRTERLNWSADEPAEGRTVSLEIPYDLAEKGDHVFEVTVEDRGAACFSKRRALIRSKAD